MRLVQQLIPLACRTDWESHLCDMPHAPGQTWAFNHAISLSAKLPTFLYSAVGDCFKAACPVAIRNKNEQNDIVTPYGASMITDGSNSNFYEEMQHFFISQQIICGYLAVHPTQNSIAFTEQHIGGTIYIHDLVGSEADWLTAMSKSSRYELTQWLKQDYDIISDKHILAQHIVNLYGETLSRVNAATVYYFQPETLINILMHPHTIALGIKNHTQVEAISLFPYTPYMADYFLNASTLKGRQHTRGLIWHAMRTLKKIHIPQLNLGGGVKPGDHLDDFKRRLAGKPQTHGVLKQIYNKNVFTKLCESIDSSTTYFPPYYSAKSNTRF